MRPQGDLGPGPGHVTHRGSQRRQHGVPQNLGPGCFLNHAPAHQPGPGVCLPRAMFRATIDCASIQQPGPPPPGLLLSKVQVDLEVKWI